MRSFLVAVVVLLSSTAHADEAADRIKAMNAAFTTLTSKLDDSESGLAEFKKLLAKDAYVSWTTEPPRTDFNGWSVGTAKKVKVLGSKAGWAGTFGWVVAELKINYRWSAEGSPRNDVDTFHCIAVFVPDGKDVKAKVVHMVKTTPDNKLTPFNYVKDQPKLESPSANIALLAQPKELAARISSDPATSILGTSDKDHGFGAAAAKKLIGGWGKVGLELLTFKDTSEKFEYLPFELTVGDATIVFAKLRMKFPGKKELYPIGGLAVFKKVGDKSELVALQYDAED